MASISVADILKLKAKLAAIPDDGNWEDAGVWLQALGNHVADKHSLKTTSIGLFVNSLRKHSKCPPSINNKCKELVLKWKSDIRTPTKPSHHSPSKPGIVMSRQHSEMEDDSAQSVPTERTVLSDDIEYTSTRDTVRDRCVELIYSALANGGFIPGEYIIKKAIEIENTCHTDLGDTPTKYKSKVRSLIANLGLNGNLQSQIVGGDIPPKVFARMSYEEMMSDDRKVVVEAAFKEIMLDVVSAKILHAETDMFRFSCGIDF